MRQPFDAPAAVVNCHCIPVNLLLSTATAGLPPVGAPVPVNGIMILCTVAVTVSAACGGYDVASPEPFGSAALFECVLSLVAYWTEQPTPLTVPAMSNWIPVYEVPSMQSVPAGLPMK